VTSWISSERAACKTPPPACASVARDFIPSLPQRKTPKMSSPDFKPSPSTHYITIADRPAGAADAKANSLQSVVVRRHHPRSDRGGRFLFFMQFSNMPRRRMEVWSKRIHFPVYLTTTSSNQPARPARSAARIPAENQDSQPAKPSFRRQPVKIPVKNSKDSSGRGL
jgi:hypothetical protein